MKPKLINYFVAVPLIVSLLGCSGKNSPSETMSAFEGLEWGKTSITEFYQQSPGGVKEWGEPLKAFGMDAFMSFDFTWEGSLKVVIQAYFISDKPNTEPAEEKNDNTFLNAIAIVSEADKLSRMLNILKRKYGTPDEQSEKDGETLYIWKSEEFKRIISLRKTAITAKAWFIPFDLYDRVPL